MNRWTIQVTKEECTTEINPERHEQENNDKICLQAKWGPALMVLNRAKCLPEMVIKNLQHMTQRVNNSGKMLSPNGAHGCDKKVKVILSNSWKWQHSHRTNYKRDGGLSWSLKRVKVKSRLERTPTGISDSWLKRKQAKWEKSKFLTSRQAERLRGATPASYWVGQNLGSFKMKLLK